jgi:hypothetical protein
MSRAATGEFTAGRARGERVALSPCPPCCYVLNLYLGMEVREQALVDTGKVGGAQT